MPLNTSLFAGRAVLTSLIDILAVQRPNLCRWKTLIMLMPMWGGMTGLLMGKSKHIKDSQMILFFFNDFAFSETDGEWKAGRERARERERERERLAARRKGERNATCWKISFGLIMINSEYICSKTARSHYYSARVLFGFFFVVTVMLQLYTGSFSLAPGGFKVSIKQQKKKKKKWHALCVCVCVREKL